MGTDDAEANHPLAPLNERVSSPARLHIPQHPQVVSWRPATLADVDAIAVMQRAIDEADHPELLTARDEIASDLEGGHIDNTRDTLLALGEDGAVLAYGMAAQAPGEGERIQVYLLGGVHPAWRERGIGRELMQWQYERARQRLAASEARLPGWITSYCEEANRAELSVALRLGMQVTRYFITMRRDLSREVEQVKATAPVRIVPFSAELSQTTLEARNDSFRDHWGNQPKSPEMWMSWVGGEAFRADLSRVAVIDERDASGAAVERVVAFSLASVNDNATMSNGVSSVHIERIGVVRSHRGQRLAPAVVSATLQAATDAGIERAFLEVDAENPTGANALYARLGFEAHERLIALVQVF